MSRSSASSDPCNRARSREQHAQMSDMQFHVMPGGKRIAYRFTPGTGPALVFLPGYMSDMAGGKGNEEIFRKEFASCPKAATDVILDHLDGCLRQADHRGENFAVGKRNLGGTMNRQKFRGRIPFGQNPARLHRQRQMALCGELLAPNIVG